MYCLVDLSKSPCLDSTFAHFALDFVQVAKAGVAHNHVVRLA